MKRDHNALLDRVQAQVRYNEEASDAISIAWWIVGWALLLAGGVALLHFG